MDIKQKRIDEINKGGLIRPVSQEMNRTIGMQLTDGEKAMQENKRLKKRIEELEQRLEAGQHETIVIDKLSDEFGYEVNGLDESLTDEEWNDKLYSHANWLKDHVESVAEKLLNDNLR